MSAADWIAIIVAVFTGIGVIVALISACDAKAKAAKANSIAKDALNVAKDANQLSQQANQISKEANAIAHDSNRIQQEAKQQQALPALKLEQINALKALHRKIAAQQLPGTTNELAEEWESNIKELASRTWKEWEGVLSHPLSEKLPKTAGEVKSIANEFFRRARMKPID